MPTQAAPDGPVDRTARRHQALPLVVGRRAHRRPRPRPHRTRRGVRRRGRPHRLRQVHHPLAGLRAGTAVRRRGRSCTASRSTASPTASATCSRPTPCCPGGPCSTTSPPARATAARRKAEAREKARDWVDRVGLGRVRDLLPAPAVRRHAQARRAGPDAGQRALDPADGRAVPRAGRADPRAHAGRAAAAVVAAPAPRSSSSPTTWRRRSRSADRVVVMTAGPATVKAIVRRAPGAAARGRGDPADPGVPRHLPRDVGIAARRGRDQPARGVPPVPLDIDDQRPIPAPRRDRGAASPGRARNAAGSPASTSYGSLLVVACGWARGSWPRRYWIDPFYYSKPTAIWDRLVDWFTDGTSQGSIWQQIAYTLRGGRDRLRCSAASAGVVLGIVLGRSRFLSDVCAPFIKAANAIPRIMLAVAVRHLVRPRACPPRSRPRSCWCSSRCSSTPSRAPARSTATSSTTPASWARAGCQVLSTIVVPSATSWILASLHSAFGFALIGAVVGEYSRRRQGPRPADHPRPGHLRLGRHLRRNDHHHGDRAAGRVAAHPARTPPAALASARVRASKPRSKEHALCVRPPASPRPPSPPPPRCP